MKYILLFLGLFICKANLGQDLKTMLPDPLGRTWLGMYVDSLPASVRVLEFSDASYKIAHLPFNAYGHLVYAKSVFISKFAIDSAIAIVTHKRTISAILYYLAGKDDSVYKLLVDRYGPPFSRSHLNTETAMGFPNQTNYFWKEKDAFISFIHGVNGSRIIAITNGKPAEYLWSQNQKQHE